MSIHSTGASRDTQSVGGAFKPLTVSIKRACEILDIGHTKMWELIGAERVKTISIGRKRLVIYSSLEALVAASAEATAPALQSRRHSRQAKS